MKSYSNCLDRRILWGSKIEQSPPTVTYEEATGEDDRGLFKWLSNIVMCPIVLGAPDTHVIYSRIDSDSRSSQVSQHLQKPQKSSQKESVLFARHNVHIYPYGCVLSLMPPTYRWKILGLYLRPCKGGYRLHYPSARRPYRYYILCTCPLTPPDV